MAENKKTITLSQAVLAPVNSILQAQVHAARSFLSMILQMGFPHKAVNDAGLSAENQRSADHLYRLSFIQEKFDNDGNSKKYEVSIPTIAALPLNPLAIEEAEVEFSMNLERQYTVRKQYSKAQTKSQGGFADETIFNDETRPWYLIDEPVELKGSIGENKSDGSQINVRLKMGKGDVPEELGRFIASLSDFSTAKPITDDQQEGEPDHDNESTE